MGFEEVNKKGKKSLKLPIKFFLRQNRKFIVTVKLRYLVGFRVCATRLKLFTGQIMEHGIYQR